MTAAALVAEGALDWALEGGRISSWLLYFLLVSLVAAFATSAMRLREPRKIVSETFRTFAAIVLGILALSAVVSVLEWIFVRPLVG